MKKLIVENMTCKHCKMRIENELKKVKKLKYKVDLDTKTITLDSKLEININEIINSLKEIGYIAHESQE